MSKIFNWKGFIGESYDWNSSYINNCLEKAKKEYSELYLNINIASHDDTEEIEPFEFIGKKGNLWYLLGEDFTAFDHGYDTYEELSNVHGLGPFNKKKFYDLFKYNSLTEIYDKLSGIIPPKYTKQDIFDNFIEFIDEDIISPIADDSEVKSFEIKWIYHKIFYSRRAIKPHGTKPCYIVNLHMIMDTPSLVNNFINVQNMNLTKDVSNIEYLLKIINTIKGRADDLNLDFYFNFDGMFLKMLFIEI